MIHKLLNKQKAIILIIALCAFSGCQHKNYGPEINGLRLRVWAEEKELQGFSKLDTLWEISCEFQNTSQEDILLYFDVRKHVFAIPLCLIEKNDPLDTHFAELGICDISQEGSIGNYIKNGLISMDCFIVIHPGEVYHPNTSWECLVHEKSVKTCFFTYRIPKRFKEFHPDVWTGKLKSTILRLEK